MGSSQRSLGWAIVSLGIGCAAAYPFLRDSDSAADSDASSPPDARALADARSSVANANHSSVSDVYSSPAESLHVQPLGLNQSSAANSVPDLSSLSTELPTWVPPQSQLESLIADGPQGRPLPSTDKQLAPLPTWTSNPREPVASHHLPPSSIAGLANRVGSSPFEPLAESADQTQFAEIGGPSSSPSLASALPAHKIDWPDARGASQDALVNRQPLPQADVSRNHAGPGSLAGNTRYSGNTPSSLVAPPVLKQKSGERKKIYVYQPGYLPDD